MVAVTEVPGDSVLLKCVGDSESPDSFRGTELNSLSLGLPVRTIMTRLRTRPIKVQKLRSASRDLLCYESQNSNFLNYCTWCDMSLS
jgi:hypothetical protein